MCIRDRYTSGEAAFGDVVLPGTELLNRLAPEVDVRILVPELFLVRFRAEGHQAVRLVKRAEAGLGVEFDRLGRYAALGVGKDDVTLGNDLMRIPYVIDAVGEELDASLQFVHGVAAVDFVSFLNLHLVRFHVEWFVDAARRCRRRRRTR